MGAWSCSHLNVNVRSCEFPETKGVFHGRSAYRNHEPTEDQIAIYPGLDCKSDRLREKIYRQWLMSVLCVRNLNNSEKRQENEVCWSHLFVRTGLLFRPIATHETTSPWTNRSRANLATAEGDGEGPVCILSGIWWSHWCWEVSRMRWMDSNSEEETQTEQYHTNEATLVTAVEGLAVATILRWNTIDA